jgi:hypothetical protein
MTHLHATQRGAEADGNGTENGNDGSTLCATGCEPLNLRTLDGSTLFSHIETGIEGVSDQKESSQSTTIREEEGNEQG